MGLTDKIKKYWWAFAGLIILIIVIVFFTSCKEGDIPFTMSEWDREVRGALNNAGIPDTHSNFKHDYTTPGGIKIRSVVPVPQGWLAKADEGIRQQIDWFAPHAPAWTAGVNLSEYTLLFVEPNYLFDWNTHQQTPPCVTEVDWAGSSCLYINGVKSVGTMIGHDDHWNKLDLQPAIILPHQAANDWTKTEFFIVSVRHESEHVRLWMNRQNEPKNLFYNFINRAGCPNCDVHPIKWWEGPATLVGQKKYTHEVK